MVPRILRAGRLGDQTAEEVNTHEVLSAEMKRKKAEK